ncbi:MAG: hypothetical protein JWN41_411 [Thermoleophilia bacterium]|nr:hypothetical protein [Thermoleophilia bacterium]
MSSHGGGSRLIRGINVNIAPLMERLGSIAGRAVPTAVDDLLKTGASTHIANPLNAHMDLLASAKKMHWNLMSDVFEAAPHENVLKGWSELTTTLERAAKSIPEGVPHGRGTSLSDGVVLAKRVLSEVKKQPAGHHLFRAETATRQNADLVGEAIGDATANDIARRIALNIERSLKKPHVN